MNFSTTEFMLGRQRCRQWVPLITDQFRLRHVYQIIGFNLLSEASGSYYFTLHLTTMCAPFYTSEQICNPNPKWELDLKDIDNTSAPCVVLRIWQCCKDGTDKIILTWGVHFSGLVYIGNKLAEIQPVYFKSNSVIFCMQGGYFTSHYVINTSMQKPVPFLRNVNVIDTLTDKVIYKHVAIKTSHSEIQNSYNLDKLRRLHSLQVEIKKKGIEVQNIKDKISAKSGVHLNNGRETSNSPGPSSHTDSVRYAPKLLTMNSLNKMLQDKPTKVQRQEMVKINKEIEIAKFKTRLLAQEKDKKNAMIRQLKQKYFAIVEEKEERSSDLMENYHILNRESEKLKEYRRSLIQHREVYHMINTQLQQRRRTLLQELLYIYPIQEHSENKYVVHGIYLPNSDILADCSDIGLSVALGYITHILKMCSTFLQVPLRYPLTHYGSMSFITDNVSPLLPDTERDFPLYTKGKDKAQFTYAVYLLNKNIAQLRWLCYMNTNDLRATLANLLSFLQGQRDLRPESLLPANNKLTLAAEQKVADIKVSQASTPNLSINEKYVSLHSFGSNSNISDPILDCIRKENQLRRSSSPTRKSSRKAASKPCRNSECGKGLSEILAIPEAFLNKQISSDSFRTYIISETTDDKNGACCGDTGSTTSVSTNDSITNMIKITNGREIASRTHSQAAKGYFESIEQGTDVLDISTGITSTKSRSIKINSDTQLRKMAAEDSFDIKQTKRISRSVGSYTDDEYSLVLRTSFELGSEPLLNITSVAKEEEQRNEIYVRNLQDGQQEFLEQWIESAPNLIYSMENLYGDEFLGSSSGQIVSENSPLMARTDALINTKSFNLVKPKP